MLKRVSWYEIKEKRKVTFPAEITEIQQEIAIKFSKRFIVFLNYFRTSEFGKLSVFFPFIFIFDEWPQ